MHTIMNISIVVVLAVFILIAVRQIGRIRLQIWHIMLFGALTVLLAGKTARLKGVFKWLLPRRENELKMNFIKGTDKEIHYQGLN